MVVLPVPLTPTTSTTPGLPSLRSTAQRPVEGGVDEREQLLAEDVAHRRGRLALDLDPGAQPLDQLLGRAHADVGGEQGVLDLLPGVLVDDVAGQQGEQPAPEGALRAGEPLSGAGPAGWPPAPGARASGATGVLDGARRGVPRGLGVLADGRLGRCDDVGATSWSRPDCRGRRPRPRVAMRPARPTHDDDGDRDDQPEITPRRIQSEGAGAVTARPARISAAGAPGHAGCRAWGAASTPRSMASPTQGRLGICSPRCG